MAAVRRCAQVDQGTSRMQHRVVMSHASLLWLSLSPSLLWLSLSPSLPLASVVRVDTNGPQSGSKCGVVCDMWYADQVPRTDAGWEDGLDRGPRPCRQDHPGLPATRHSTATLLHYTRISEQRRTMYNRLHLYTCHPHSIRTDPRVARLLAALLHDVTMMSR